MIPTFGAQGFRKGNAASGLSYLCRGIYEGTPENKVKQQKKKIMQKNKKELVRIMVQVALSVLSALATAFGLQSCGIV